MAGPTGYAFHPQWNKEELEQRERRERERGGRGRRACRAEAQGGPSARASRTASRHGLVQVWQLQNHVDG